ncbi:hypothetical protein EGR_04754 [Echinococcus granulosus]|uniref:Uncharacterized protein n=1 Tax=Echinococcus granulosus TaxID=6210 RepID=W6UQ02_ECHGR|nr:hypothetical protein EGR_04754 [Echinococcus granulosus]EUB60372.1 hypothetical protein EGR_04754 [Echinococcus granulosus]
MSEDNSWRTTLPPSSATTSTETTVVRPDTLNIGATTISMDLLTPQLLQFLQNCQPAAASTTSTPDAKVLDASSTYLSALDREYRLRTSNTATSNHRNHRSGSAQLILPSLTLLHWIPTAQTFASARLASMGIIDDRYGVLVSIASFIQLSLQPSNVPWSLRGDEAHH